VSADGYDRIYDDAIARARSGRVVTLEATRAEA
jgi:hypothetical protein